MRSLPSDGGSNESPVNCTDVFLGLSHLSYTIMYLTSVPLRSDKVNDIFISTADSLLSNIEKIVSPAQRAPHERCK